MRTDALSVYWAARVEVLGSLATQGPRPQNFVTRQPSWDTIKSAVDRDDLKALVPLRASEQLLGKLDAEAVYETVRLKVLPDAPSRLTCLFAALGVIEAVEFGVRHSAPPAFGAATGFPISGTMGVPATTGTNKWVALDMNAFQAVVVPPDEPSLRKVLGGLAQIAEAYWRGTTTAHPFIEVLAEGLDVDGWAGGASVPTAP